MIRHIAESQDRLWVLNSTSPYLGWSFRPLERYLAQHYYPVGEVKAENGPTRPCACWNTVREARRPIP